MSLICGVLSLCEATRKVELFLFLFMSVFLSLSLFPSRVREAE